MITQDELSQGRVCRCQAMEEFEGGEEARGQQVRREEWEELLTDSVLSGLVC